jgi:MFS family permease
MSLPLYTLSLFLPTIIADLGYSAASAQLLTIPPYALATILTTVVAFISERVGRRAPFLIASSLTASIGYCILLSNTNPTERPAISYVGVFFAAAGIYPTTGLVLSWPAVNVGGQTKRAVANALQITIGNCGAIIGTQVYRVEDSPRYVHGHGIALAYTLVSAGLTCFTWYWLNRCNKKKEQEEPGSGVVGGAGGLKGDTDPRWRFML